MDTQKQDKATPAPKAKYTRLRSYIVEHIQQREIEQDIREALQSHSASEYIHSQEVAQ